MPKTVSDVNDVISKAEVGLLKVFNKGIKEIEGSFKDGESKLEKKLLEEIKLLEIKFNLAISALPEKRIVTKTEKGNVEIFCLAFDDNEDGVFVLYDGA